VLAAIEALEPDAAAATPVAVAADGGFRLGPAHGRWHKDAPAYIGRGARAAARRRRLAVLDAALADLDARLEANAGAREALDQRHARLSAEWQVLPDDEALRAAHNSVARCLAECQRLASALATARAELEQARTAEQAAAEQRDRAAEDLQLPPAGEALEAIGTGVDQARQERKGFEPILERHASALDDLAGARRALEEAATRRSESAQQAAEQQEKARAMRLEYDTLQASVGQRVEELQAALAEAAQAERDAASERDAVEQARRDNTGELQRYRAQVEEREQQIEQADADRREAITALQAVHDDGLLRAAVADIEAPESAAQGWALDPGVRLARRLEEALADVDDSDAAWERSRNRMHERVTELQQALSRHGHDAHAEHREAGLVVQVVFHGSPHSPDDLARALAAEETERARILDERERAILENHLIEEVARSLQELIQDAERQARAISDELQERPTSTGMRLRIRWRPLAEGDDEDVPAGLGEARERLLRQTADAWSEADREAVGRFLKRQIDRVRETAEGGSLLEQLEQALDYRRWHRFRIERWQDGQWRPARGPASGGERVLTVTLPLFAAASSHYRSGAATAPRLIALDEAFAGVDDAARAQCMGLLAQFDLDFMMTSEREWGCYATIPGLAIAHLSRFEGIDAVHISRWRWDGQHCERQPDAAHEVGEVTALSPS
jgi:uncharacterized protein (TIGR02680 family)